MRGGGHSCIGAALRDESLLLDLGCLKQVSIDYQTRMAAVQPAVTGRDLNNQLAPHGLAFPVGHCPSVPLSGFILNGGLGWNSRSCPSNPHCWTGQPAHIVVSERYGGTFFKSWDVDQVVSLLSFVALSYRHLSVVLTPS